MICRAAVPFFFITSGYFLARHQRFSVGVVLKPLRRLLPIYIFWMSVYFVFLLVIPIHPWSFGFRDLLSGGTAFHLWFLPALGVALAIVGAGLSLAPSAITGIACAVLAAFALTRGTYHDVLGLHGAASRGGLFVAPLYVYVGTLLAGRRLAFPHWACAAFVLLAYALLFAEEQFIAAHSGLARPMSHDFTIATFPLGAAMFLFARSIGSSRFIDRFAPLGRASLAIYASHLLFLWLLLPLIGNDSVLRVFASATAAFLLATALGLTLARISFLKRVAT
jgi:surface polysaccharide O-acyltransferase-like enzyme